MVEELTRIKELVHGHTGQKAQNLASNINQETLYAIHKDMNAKKAYGIDGISKEEYSVDVMKKLDDLVTRLKHESYKPNDTRRVYIDKPGSDKKRPLGISCYEDKLVEKNVAQLLEIVYEPIFKEFSYGFRPERNCQQAIAKVIDEVQHHKISYVVEADIKSFFDTLNHDWLMVFLEHDIADRKFIDIIRKQLKAGIMDDGKHLEKEMGTTQGGCASAILANVYLHYSLDNWFEWEVQKSRYRGEAYLTRYADDSVACFQYKSDAERFYRQLGERLGKFGLTLAEDKTRILEFGRFAAQNRKNKKEEKPETFSFLGFTFYCAVTRKGYFCIKIKSDHKKVNSKLNKLSAWLKENRHLMKPHELVAKMNKSLIGYYGYYAVSDNILTVQKFRYEAIKLLFKWLNHRSQRRSFTWDEFNLFITRVPIVSPRLKHNLHVPVN
jgi:group II intron reverse transcriptase/maturase